MNELDSILVKFVNEVLRQHCIGLEFLFFNKKKDSPLEIPIKQIFYICGGLIEIPEYEGVHFFVTAKHCFDMAKEACSYYDGLECRMHDGDKKNIIFAFPYNDFFCNTKIIDDKSDICFYQMNDQYLLLKNLEYTGKKSIQCFNGNRDYNKRINIAVLYGKRSSSSCFDIMIFHKNKDFEIIDTDEKYEVRLYSKRKGIDLTGVSGSILFGIGINDFDKNCFYNVLGVQIGQHNKNGDIKKGDGDYVVFYPLNFV